MGFIEKSDFFFWEGGWKTNIEDGLPKKGGHGQFAHLRGGLDRKDGGDVFEGGLIPQCILWTLNISHPPHYKTNPTIPGFHLFLVKNSHPLITNIFERCMYLSSVTDEAMLSRFSVYRKCAH